MIGLLDQNSSIPRNACVACETLWHATTRQTDEWIDRQRDRQMPDKVILMCIYICIAGDIKTANGIQTSMNNRR